MALTLDQALNSYGFVGQLANAIPDLRTLLNQAITNEWVPEQFTRAVMDSGWWRNNAESVRQLQKLQTTDPATYNQNLINAAAKIGLIAGQMGRSVDTTTIAWRALAGNWDDEQIRLHIAQNGALVSNSGALTSDAAQLMNHLQELTAKYGVAQTSSSLTGWVNQIQQGAQTLDGYEAVMRARAKAQYPQLAAEIDAGLSVRDIADPYIATMAQTLEVPETELSLSTPEVAKALQQRSTDGVASTQPMWEFQRALKNDPRWDKTVNARQAAYGIVQKIGKDFGFQS